MNLFQFYKMAIFYLKKKGRKKWKKVEGKHFSFPNLIQMVTSGQTKIWCDLKQAFKL